MLKYYIEILYRIQGSKQIYYINLCTIYYIFLDMVNTL